MRCEREGRETGWVKVLSLRNQTFRCSGYLVIASCVCDLSMHAARPAQRESGAAVDIVVVAGLAVRSVRRNLIMFGRVLIHRRRAGVPHALAALGPAGSVDSASFLECSFLLLSQRLSHTYNLIEIESCCRFLLLLRCFPDEFFKPASPARGSPLCTQTPRRSAARTR